MFHLLPITYILFNAGVPLSHSGTSSREDVSDGDESPTRVREVPVKVTAMINKVSTAQGRCGLIAGLLNKQGPKNGPTARATSVTPSTLFNTIRVYKFILYVFDHIFYGCLPSSPAYG